MVTKFITASVVDEDIETEQPAIEKVFEGKNISFAEMEAFYKKPGGTLMHSWLGADPFDFWLGRFYVGTFGIISLIGIFVGTFSYLYQAYTVEGVTNLFQARIDPPPISAGLRIVSPSEPGFFWQMIVIFATIAFLGWTFRQVDISRKLGMSYEIPIAYGAVVTSWLTLQWFRPLAMGAWGNGFALGITHHLDWVSNIGYQYYNFFFNPFHAIGVSLLFGSTLFLAMHGSAILSTVNRPYVKEGNVDGFWRNLLGYSIGEIGIHRLALWAAMLAVLFANLCIFLSGTLVFNWTGFWSFWNELPIWANAAAWGGGFAAIGGGVAATVIWRGRNRRQKPVDMEEYEYGRSGLEGTAIQKPMDIGILRKLFGLGQVGPVYLGIPGLVAVVTGTFSVIIQLENFLFQVGYNPLLFMRQFWVLALNPPPMEYGLSLAPWREGGAWILSMFLLHVAVLAWWVRVRRRAKEAGLGTHLSRAFASAIFLYLIIYLFRPMAIGNWAQAPGRGFKAVLSWTNNMNVLYGNFYYNPFHMISIFFLLGSTLLLAMHGATIVATSRYGSHREIEEMMVEGTGTQRAELFWRWTMGFNANSHTIHQWAWWFAVLCMVAGGIGLFLTGVVIDNWFEWAQGIGIVAPLP